MTDEKPLFDSQHPDFTAMPFEELMTTDCKDDKFNNALWSEQSERFNKLGIADAELLSQVDKYQDEIAARLKKLELKLHALIIMAEEYSDLKVPCKKQTLNEYLEDLIK